MEMENIASEDKDKKKQGEKQESSGHEVDSLTTENEKQEMNPENMTEHEDDESTEHESHKEKKKHKKTEHEIESLKQEVHELKDKYLRLYSEFENFRRRTSKEKLELIKTAGEELIVSMLPVIDDLERAIKAMSEKETEDKSSLEGIKLILSKLKYTIEQRGLKKMDVSTGDDFNPEIHEAITKIPVEDEKLKGKIVEVLEKGYYLHDKVIRFAKVVTGS